MCGFWRTAPVILHFYGFIAKDSVAPAPKSSLPNDIHQWKRTHQNRNKWAAHPRQGWFTLLALKYFTCFSISSWEFPTSSFRASISCVKAFSMTKQDKGWTMETQKEGHKKWMLQIDHCRMAGSNKQMWSWHQHRKEGRDCTEIPEQSSPCLLLWGFQLVAALPLILFFHPSRWSLKKSRETTLAGWKKMGYSSKHTKFGSVITSHPITSLRGPQWDQAGGTNRKNKTGTSAEPAGFI